MRLCVRLAALLLFLSFIHPFAFSQTQRADQSYYSGSIDQMRQQAKTLQKPYILFFHAEWSTPSKDVELNCIKNLQIQDFLKREFLLYKVDMDSRASNAPANLLAQHYQVSLYPTFIFFAPDGFILKKLSGSLDMQSFGDELADIRQMAVDREESTLSGELGEGEENWIPEEFFDEDDGSATRPGKTIPAKTDWSSLIEDENVKPKKPIKSDNSPKLEGPSEMYAVQLGAYTQRTYAQKQLDKVLRESNFPAEIREIQVNGVKYFKVVVGPYASKPKAEQQRIQVVRQLGNSGSFIIKIPR